MTLRDHARERGIPFTIDRKTFVQFVSKNQYIDKRGLGAACLTIDRIDNRRGYEPGYTQDISLAGVFAEDRIEGNPALYNNGKTTRAIRKEEVEQMARLSVQWSDVQGFR